ncbi:MAG: extracellular solute-binding protein [Eubacterium sp.]|nr:extracellular solute-binding protein [Eubacterium sp.]
MKKRKTYAVLLFAFLAVFLATGLAGCTKTKTGQNKADNVATGKAAPEDAVGTDEEKAGAGTDVKETQAAAKGRYLEAQIDLPKGFSGKEGAFFQLADKQKSLGLLDTENCMAYLSTNQGKSWEQVSLSGYERFYNEERVAACSSAAISEDGNIFLSCIMNDERPVIKYLYFNVKKPEEEVKSFQMELVDGSELLNRTVFTKDGRLFAMSTTQNVYEVYPQKGSCRRIFTVDDYKDEAMCVNGDYLTVVDGSKAYTYNIKTGKTEDTDEVLSAYVAKQRGKSLGAAICAASDGKKLYIAGSNGIAGHVAGGSVMEQLVDGALTCLGDPSKVPITIIQNEDGSFYVFFENGELYSYVYDKDASAVPEKQLVIYGLYDNETVRRAISVFRKKHPEVFVRFDTALTGETGMTKNDAVKNLNTELLAGEGPDLILLDDMPYGSYEEKGMLADLSGIADEMEQSGDYFAGILNGFQNEGKTYVLPFRYQVPLLAGETSVLKEITDLKTLADAAQKLAGTAETPETVLGCYTPQEVLEKLYLCCVNAWMDADGTVDTGALQEFLTYAKAIYEADRQSLDEQEMEAHMEYVEHIKGHYKNEKEAANVLFAIGRVYEQIAQKQRMSAGYLTTIDDFLTLLAVKRECAKQHTDLGYQPLSGQEKGIFCPIGTVGISIHAKEKELAEAFIRVLFSGEVQGSDFDDGFPVNADAFADFTTNPTPGMATGFGAEDRDGNSILLGLDWPSEQELAELKEMLHTLDTPALFEESLKKEVLEIGSQALKGEKGIEEGAQEIAQKLSLYLKE